jgi:hypothetical protein
MMMSNSLVLERDDQLILGAGVFPEWLEEKRRISLGPVYTVWGPVEIHVTSAGSQVTIEWKGHWYSQEPRIKVQIPGLRQTTAEKGKTGLEIARKDIR